MSTAEPGYDPELRQLAITRLKKRRDFLRHLLVYLFVNSFIVAIWAATSSGGFFWPIFPIVGWGIGVVMNAWDVYFSEDFDEDAIQGEIKHLEQRR